jgi:hypothetical protein
MGKEVVVIFCFLVAFLAIKIGLGIEAAVISSEVMEDSFIPTDFMNQVATDWQSKSFVKLAVTNETYCPPETPDLVFSRKWHGVDIGCDCLGIDV